MDDEQLFQERFKKYKGLVLRIIRRYARDESVIDDLTQQTFIKAWIYRATFKGECTYSTWLCKIAINTTINHLTQQRGKIKVFDPEFYFDRVPKYFMYSPTDTIASDLEELLQVEKDIKALPEKLRTALVMHTLYGYSYEELALVLEVPIGTVRSRIFRARELIRPATA